MAEIPRKNENENPEDIGDLTSDEYTAKLREGELPNQQPVAPEQAQEPKPAKKTAKLTLGGKTVEVAVSPDEPEKSEQLAESEKGKEISVENELKNYKEGQDVGVGMLGDDKVRVYDTVKWKFIEVVTDSRSGKDVKVVVVENEKGGKIRIPADIFLKMQEERPEVKKSGPNPEPYVEKHPEFLDRMMGLKSHQETEGVEEEQEKARKQRQEELDEQKKRAQGLPKSGPVVGPVSREQAEQAKKPQKPPKVKAPKTPREVDKGKIEQEEQKDGVEVETEKPVRTRKGRAKQEKPIDESMKHVLEVQEIISKELEKRAELPKELKDSVVKTLESELRQKQEDFLLQWFEDHKDLINLKSKGISEDISDEQKKIIAKNNGALTRLFAETVPDESGGKRKTKLRYEKEAQEIMAISDMRMDFAKDGTPLESQYLALNFLQKKSEMLEREGASEKELDDIFKVRKELAEKLTNRDFASEAKQEAEAEIPPETKEDYIAKHLKLEGQGGAIELANDRALGDLWAQYYNYSPEKKAAFYDELFSGKKFKKGFQPATDAEGLLKHVLESLQINKDVGDIKMDRESFLTLLNLGYKPQDMKQTWNWFRPQIEIYRNGKKETIRLRDFDNFFEKAKMENRLTIEQEEKQKLEQEWQKQEMARAKRTNELVESKITEQAGASEQAKYKAISGVEAIYQKMRERFKKAALETATKEKTKAEQKEIDKEFGGSKKTKKGEKAEKSPEQSPVSALEKLYADIVKSEEKLKLKGELDEDTSIISDYFKQEWGLEAKPDDLRKMISSEDYRYAKTWRHSLLGVFLRVIAQLGENPTEKSKQKKRKSRGKTKK